MVVIKALYFLTI